MTHPPTAVATEPDASRAPDAAVELVAELVAAVGREHVLTDADTVEPFRRDMQALAEAGAPLAVVRPRTTAEVQAVVRACAAARAPIVPRGAGSGVTAGANAVDGAVSLVTTRMTDVAIDTENLLAVVQPGAITLEIKKAAEAHGLFYAPDPTSADWCTIGGNLANGSAGPCGAKYGVTADAVRGLEVVLADGEILRTGRSTLKGVTGYDLDRLFIGSEGTLGVITQASLALSPAPAAPTTCVATFDDVRQAVQTVSDVVASGHRLSMLEIMDAACLGAVEEHVGASLIDDAPTPAATLFGQVDTTSLVSLEAFSAAAEENGATFVYMAADTDEGSMLMAFWEGLEEALEAMGTWILHEVTVPRRRLDELILRVAEARERRGAFIGVHGHSQDGTVHPMIVYRDEAEREAAFLLYDDVLEIARELGGPVTGEHGIGRMKQSRLADAVGEVGMRVHHAIKSALDPHGLLNPGCMIAPGGAR